MINELVQRFDAARPALLASFKADAPTTYVNLVRRTVEVIDDGDDLGVTLDPTRITVIGEHDDYSGAMLFVLRTKYGDGYLVAKMDYGSCSVCDTLQSIPQGWGDDYIVTDAEAAEYLTLALHFVQRLKEVE
jgi:hypothetical protein